MILAPSASRLLDLETDIHDLAAQLGPAVVAVRNGNGDGGSGVHWSPDLVVTNHHVAHEDNCRVEFRDGRTVDAKVLARDPVNDLALLRLDTQSGETVFSLTVRRKEPLRVGQIVLAIGHPMGVDWAITAGILSRLPGPDDRRKLIRASVTLLPGNSGGPLIDASGALIGINTMLSGPAEAMAVPVEVVDAFVAASRQKLGNTDAMSRPDDSEL